jgi:hypothetical protein
MALLMARTYVFQSSCQCADVPIGFFVLLAICFITMSRQETPPTALRLIAGAAAGFAAWTKNEGMLVLILAMLVSSFPPRQFRALASVIAGAAVPVLALGIFKLHLAPANYLFSLQSFGGMAEKFADQARWTTVTDRLAALVPAWGEVPGGALVCLAVVVALTARPDRRSLDRTMFGLLLTTSLFVGYGLAYVVTPLSLEWQIATSFDRLFTQLWPALVWTMFQLSGSTDGAELAEAEITVR